MQSIHLKNIYAVAITIAIFLIGLFLTTIPVQAGNAGYWEGYGANAQVDCNYSGYVGLPVVHLSWNATDAVTQWGVARDSSTEEGVPNPMQSPNWTDTNPHFNGVFHPHTYAIYDHPYYSGSQYSGEKSVSVYANCAIINVYAPSYVTWGLGGIYSSTSGNGTLIVPATSSYTIYAQFPSGYSYSVSNSDGGSDSLYISADQSKSFTITSAPQPRDCQVSDWSAWSAGDWGQCSVSYGGGTQSRTLTRTRYVTVEPQNGGASCPALTESTTESRACNEVCAPPTSQTETQTIECSSRDATQVGQIQQSRSLTKSAYPSCSWNYSAWTDTSNNCTPGVCTSPTSESQTIQCSSRDVDWTGTISQSRSKSAYPTCTFGGWSDTAVNCSCVGPAQEDRTLSCPAGQLGSGVQERRTRSAYSSCDMGTWTEISRDCYAYSLSANSFSVQKGEQDSPTSASNTITKTTTGGSNKAVNISLSGVPDGVTYTISNQGCASSSCSYTVSYSVTSNAPVGSHSITVTGSPGGVSTSFTMEITAVPTVNVVFGQSVSIPYNSSANLTWSSTNTTGKLPCEAGGAWSGRKASSGSQSTGNLTSSQAYTMRCSRNNDSTWSAVQTVNITVAPQPATVTVMSNLSTAGWSVSPESKTGTGTGSVTINPPAGGAQYSLLAATVPNYDPPTVSNGTGGGSTVYITPGQNIVFTVTYTESFNYNLSVQDNPVVIRKGGSDRYGETLIYKTFTGNPQSVDLSVSFPEGQPAGVQAYLQPSQCPPSCDSSNLQFTVDKDTIADTYPVRVTGSPLGKTVNFYLRIEDSPAIIVNCSATPNPAALGSQVTWTGTVSGGVPPYTNFTWSALGGSPSSASTPTNEPFKTTYSTVGTKRATLTVRDDNELTGTCSPEGEVRINFNPGFEEF